MALDTSKIMDKYGITASEIKTTAKGIMKRDLAQLSCAKDRALVADEIKKASTASPDKASKANGKGKGKVQDLTTTTV